MLATPARLQQSQAQQLLGGWNSTCQTAQMSVAHWTSTSRNSNICSSWTSRTPKISGDIAMLHENNAKLDYLNLYNTTVFGDLAALQRATRLKDFHHFRGLQHQDHMSTGCSAEGCPGEAGIPRTTTSGLTCYGGTCMDAFLRKHANVLFFSNL